MVLGRVGKRMMGETIRDSIWFQAVCAFEGIT